MRLAFFIRGNPLSFILILFIFQLFFIFQGLSLTDSGAYAIMYQNIFDAPESVEFHFNFWLTSIVGGLWLKLFPFMGLLGLRIFGILMTGFTLLIVYNLLKPHVDVISLRIGLLIWLVLVTIEFQLEFNYNQLSLLFWVAASYFLFKVGRSLPGVQTRRLPLLFAGESF